MKTGLDLEAIEARRDGARLVSNSGRGFWKGDASLKNFIIDYKHSEKSFTLNVSKWAKVTADGMQNGHRNGTIKVIFENDGKPLRLWIISEANMRDYLRLMEEEENNGT